MQNINKHRNKAENNIRDIFSAVILTKAVSQTDIQPLAYTNTKLTLNCKESHEAAVVGFYAHKSSLNI